MSTVREYFVTEAREYLAALEGLLAADEAFDADALLRHARALRGGAQMADDETVVTLASALESAARALAAGRRTRSAALDSIMRDTVSLLRDLVASPPDGDDDRTSAMLRRWSAAGIDPAGGRAASPYRDDDGLPSASANGTPAGFRAFAATQAEGILSVLDGALDALRERPRDREPLKAILRRQRALLGAAALDSLPVLAETLRAVDDVTHLVARVRPDVTGEWLDPYVAARDVLDWVVRRIRRGGPIAGEPEALERLRTATARLIEAHADAQKERAAPDTPSAAEISAEDRAVFRREAATLLDRMARMAAALSTAPEGRRATLRQELQDAFTALSDNARAFGLTDAAALALTGRTWLEAGDPAALDALLDRVRGRIEADESGDAPETPARGAVPIERLLYRGDAALRRALELRPALEAALADQPDARAALDEVFDLIRSALE